MRGLPVASVVTPLGTCAFRPELRAGLPGSTAWVRSGPPLSCSGEIPATGVPLLLKRFPPKSLETRDCARVTSKNKELAATTVEPAPKRAGTDELGPTVEFKSVSVASF